MEQLGMNDVHKAIILGHWDKLKKDLPTNAMVEKLKSMEMLNVNDIKKIQRGDSLQMQKNDIILNALLESTAGDAFEDLVDILQQGQKSHLAIELLKAGR